MLKNLRRTKIVTTLGPSTDIKNNLEKIILAGSNVLRLNFSHGTSNEHKLRAEKAFNIMKNTGLYFSILADLQGPKIRISKFKKNKVFLNTGNVFILDPFLKSSDGDQTKVGFKYKNLPNDLKKNDILLLDDGKIQLKVFKIKNKIIYTRVIVGGVLSNNKGINKLGGGLSAKSLTKKDKKDIKTSVKIGVDYLAISFPRSSKDLIKARKIINKLGSKIKIIAKIERSEVLVNDKILDDIILSSDIIMVARGDLGIEIGYDKLAYAQKKIISRATQLNKIVITATQMMESMISNPIPTRAEVMDISNAILDGSDAVMLSGETSVGKYPVETVKIVSKICQGAEKIPVINVSKNRLNLKFKNIEETISTLSMYAANHLYGVNAIISLTESGLSTLMTSRINSRLPIFALSRNIKTLKELSVCKGVIPIYFNTNNKNNTAANEAICLLKKKKFLFTGDVVIITQCDIINTQGKTNTMRIIKV